MRPEFLALTQRDRAVTSFLALTNWSALASVLQSKRRYKTSKRPQGPNYEGDCSPTPKLTIKPEPKTDGVAQTKAENCTLGKLGQNLTRLNVLGGEKLADSWQGRLTSWLRA